MNRLGMLLAVLALIPFGMASAQVTEPGPREKTPQLVVDVSASLIDAVVRQSIERTEPFHESILDSQVSGRQRTSAKVRGELWPDPCRGAFWVIIQGTSCARGIGRQDNLLTHTEATTSFEVGQLITLDGKKITRARGPANAEAKVALLGATGLDGDPDTLMAQLAPLGFKRQKATIARHSAERTGLRASERLEEELVPHLTAGARALKQALTWGKGVGLPAESLRFSTVPSRLQGRVRFALAEAKEPEFTPTLPAQLDLGVRVHETVLNQAAHSALGGVTMTVADLTTLTEKVTQMVLREIRKDPPKEGLKNLEKLLADLTGKQPTVRFADQDPVTVHFTKDGFSIEAHIVKIDLEALVLGATRIKVRYRLENKDDGVYLTRQGPIEIVPKDRAADEKKLGLLAKPFQVLTEAIAEEIFQPRYALAEIAIPAQYAKVSPLVPARATTDRGWLVVGWKLRTR